MNAKKRRINSLCFGLLEVLNPKRKKKKEKERKYQIHIQVYNEMWWLLSQTLDTRYIYYFYIIF